MLYTTYINNIKNIPENVTKIFVARFYTEDITLEYLNENNISHFIGLSPSEEIFKEYKRDGMWMRFQMSFEKEMTQRWDLKGGIDGIINSLKEGVDICLICYEKDYKHCHRYLLAKRIMKLNRDIEWREIK